MIISIVIFSSNWNDTFVQYIFIGLAILVLETLIFIINIVIFCKLKEQEKRRKMERREARRLRTLSHQVQPSEQIEDRDVGEFLCKMIDTAKIGPPIIKF